MDLLDNHFLPSVADADGGRLQEDQEVTNVAQCL
ncbi:hypothetical protein ACP4OV_003891 [Aristida adscensionis]